MSIERESTLRQIARAEAEFGAGIQDILQGFASDGESLSTTADILGMNRKTLRRFVSRRGFEIAFPDAESCNAKRNQRRPGCLRGVRRASECNPHYVRLEFEGVVDTIAGHCRRIGLSKSTVYKRFARGLPAQMALSRGSFVCPPACNKNHIWRK